MSTTSTGTTGSQTERITEIKRSLEALELAAVRFRGDARRRLDASDEELTALLHLAHHGGVAQRQLTEVTALSRSGAGAMLQRLERDGFVERRANPDDRRERLVELSANGRERLCIAWRELTETTDRLLSDREPNEQEALSQVLDALAAAFQAMHGESDASPLSATEGEPIWRHWS